MPGDSEPPPAIGAEFDAIARWTAEPPTGDVAVGPGDDCAWVNGLAVSVDTVVEGVHFRFDWSSPQDVGWKAMTAALSDLAASRARPRGALISLAIPSAQLAEGATADRLMAGAREASTLWSCPLIGGDVVHTPGPISLSVTVLGEGLGPPLLRSGARPGDLVQVSGPTGWAALAVRELGAGRSAPEKALAAHRRPQPRLDLLDSLATATACVDISDGLLADAWHLAESSGVTLRLDHDACLHGAPEEGADGALRGGEDYELLATAPEPLRGFRIVGKVTAGGPGLEWTDGALIPRHGGGWDHGELA